MLPIKTGIDFASWYTTGVTGPDAVNLDLPVGVPLSAFGMTDTLGNSGGWGGPFGDTFTPVWSNEQTLESKALFFEASYQATQDLDVWFSLRYTDDTKTIDFDQGFTESCITCNEVFTALANSVEIALQTEESWDEVSPGFGLNYAIDDDMMLYAKYVTGFKAGGFNRIASRLDLIPFDSETTESIELGVKSSGGTTVCK